MMEKTSPIDIPRDDPPSADAEVAKLRLQLSHKSLEELVKDGLVRWDRENTIVRKGPHFDRGRPLKI
jgi:hypothetical protein